MSFAKDLILFSKELDSLEKEITLFHAKAVNETLDNHIKGKLDIDNSDKEEPMHVNFI